jgi:hypothetical protein
VQPTDRPARSMNPSEHEQTADQHDDRHPEMHVVQDEVDAARG